MTTATKITDINRTTCRLLTDRINEALESLGEELGLSIKVQGGGRFSPTNVTFKVEASVTGEDGEEDNSTMAADFRKQAALYGLQASDLGRTFRQRRSTFTIIGCKPRSYKYPILCRNQNGKVYKFPVDQVKRGLAT